MAYRGRYQVKNIGKYKGDAGRVTYRSGLELRFMNYLDRHQDVLEWSSEEVVVPYRSPLDSKLLRYFVDFYVKRRTRDGNIEIALVEIKPKYQCGPPVAKSRKTRRFIMESRTWAINKTKWDAASDFCARRGWKFIVLTEKDIEAL